MFGHLQYRKFGKTATLALNYTRDKFFPVIRDHRSGSTMFFLSLGLFFKFFTKSRAVIKTKTMYLVVAAMLRKVL
jgi:hypothetical protein